VYASLFGRPPLNDFDSQARLLTRFFYYWRDGYFPLWTIQQHGGMPMSYDLAGSGALAPFNWIYGFFPSVYEGRILPLLLHEKLIFIGLAALFAYLFFKKCGASRSGSLLGAAGFAFGARMLDHLRYSTPLETLCLVPALAWLIEKMLESPRRVRFEIAFSVILGLMILSGQPQHPFYVLLFIIPYATYRIGLKPSGVKRLIRFLSFVALGIALGAPFWLPFMRDAMPILGDRVSGALMWNDQYQMDGVSFWANFGFPWFADVHSAYAMSVPVLVFFVYGILHGLRPKNSIVPREKIVFFALFFIICLFYAFGSKSPIWRLITDLIPPLRMLRAPGRFLGVGSLCFAGVGALGFSAFIKDLENPRRVFPWVTALALTAIGVGFALFLRRGGETALAPFSPCRIHSSLPLARFQFFFYVFYSAVTVFLIASYLTRRLARPFIMSAFLVLSILEPAVYAHWGTWYSDIPVKPLTSHAVFSSIDTFRYRSVELNPVGTFWPVLDGRVHFDAPASIGQFLIDGGNAAAKLYVDIDDGILSYTANYVPAPEGVRFRVFQGSGLPLRDVTVIAPEDVPEDLPAKRLNPALIPKNKEARFTVLEYTPNRIRFLVFLPENGFVNYLENIHPGFKATVDGKPARLIRTYGTFQGLFLKAGWHDVFIEYRSRAWTVGLALCAFAGGLLILLAARSLTARGPSWAKRWPVLIAIVLYAAGCVALNHALERRISKNGRYQFFPWQPPTGVIVMKR